MDKSTDAHGPFSQDATIAPAYPCADHNADRLFPIVGIGASAGGLEALEQFFSHVPDNMGIAFIVIQHLDPNHKGMMPELLQRTTAMTVLQAQNPKTPKPQNPL
jgi:two-component system CheB/CheR fusion protein